MTRGYPARPPRSTRAPYRPHPVRGARPQARPTPGAYFGFALGVLAILLVTVGLVVAIILLAELVNLGRGR